MWNGSDETQKHGRPADNFAGISCPAIQQPQVERRRNFYQVWNWRYAKPISLYVKKNNFCIYRIIFTLFICLHDHFVWLYIDNMTYINDPFHTFCIHFGMCLVGIRHSKCTAVDEL